MVDLNLDQKGHHFHLSDIALMALQGLIYQLYYQLYNLVLYKLQNDICMVAVWLLPRTV